MTDINIHTADGITRFQGTAKKSTLGTESILDLDTEVDSTILILTPPDRSANIQITCTLVNASSGDGLFLATTSSAIFDAIPGRWRVQAKYNMTTDGVPIYSQIKTFTVQETLTDS